MRYDDLVREDLGAKFTCQVGQLWWSYHLYDQHYWFFDQIHFKFIFHQQLHQASNTNRTPPVSREIHVSLNCKYKISNYHSHQWQMITVIMINVVITKHGYVRLFVGGAEEMWERVKSSSPKFLYQTSDSANHHSAIIKLLQCNYKTLTVQL